MSKRIPLSKATQAWKMLDEEYPGLMDALANRPNYCSRDMSGADRSTWPTLRHMGEMSGVPYTLGQDAYLHYCSLSNVDPRYFPFCELAWMARWRECKQVYRIDPVVAEEIEATPIDGKIPVEAFRRMPYPIVYVERPTRVARSLFEDGKLVPGSEKTCGFLAYVDVDEKGCEQLCICYVLPDGRRTALLYDMSNCETLDEMVDDALSMDDDFDARSGSKTDTSPEQRAIFKDCTAKALSLLLYVISEENDPVPVYAPAKRPANVPNAKRREQNPDTVTLLGSHIGRKLGEARRTSSSLRSSNAAPAQRTTAPHMRRAHWAHYWTGKRKGRTDGKFGDELIVRWISPIAVNAGEQKSETIHE